MAKIVALVIASSLGIGACSNDGDSGRKHPNGAAQPSGKVLPVTVHLLHFEGAPSLTTQTSDSEVRSLIAEANQIWSSADLSIVVDAVRSEEAIHDAAAIAWLTASHSGEGPDAVLAHLTPLRPAVSPEPGRVHIYFIGTLPCNGITMGPDAVFVQDHPRLREVDGGARDPRARVMAHELGHTLGLFHAAEPDQLMYPGSTGVRLTDREIATAVQSIPSAH